MKLICKSEKKRSVCVCVCVRACVCVCVRACTHGIRQANVTVGMVWTAAVDLVWVAGLFHYHRAGLHRFWSAGQQHKQRTHFTLYWKTKNNVVTQVNSCIVLVQQCEEVCVHEGWQGKR